MSEDAQLASQLLSRCATDLRLRVQRDELRRAYAREAEITAALQLLEAHQGPSPILLGRPRAGKTALAHEIARRIVVGDVVGELREMRIYEMTPASILAGLQFGEGWRSNISSLFAFLHENGPVLLFLRDLHMAVGAGVRRGDDSDDDLASALEASLRGTSIKLIAESRPDRWQQIAAEREGLADLFVSVELKQPSDEDLRLILEHGAESVTERTGIPVTESAKGAVIDIARRFILNQAFPGKAIELLEDALIATQRSGARRIDAPQVISCFRNRTGLTEMLLDDNTPFNESQVRRAFCERVLGQEPAVGAMVQKLALLKARLHDPTRPMGVYLYLGPTGVGKTELAKTLAATLFGSEERFVRFNMADYSGEYDHLQFFGKSWGDTESEQRGKLTMALINLPFAVLLLDEFEKAHRSIFNRFLQLFDEGLLVNAMGEEVNLRNTIIIMTSNFGASIVQGESWGFAAREGLDAMERRVLRATEEFFSPEFINRLDGVTFFKPLSQSDMRLIAARELRKLFDREGLARRDVHVELDDGVLDVLLKQGYSIRYGARYLKRQIEKMVTYPLASALLSNPTREGGTLRLYATRDHIKAAWIDLDEEPPVITPESPGQVVPETIEAAGELLSKLKARLEALSEALNVAAARERQGELLEEMSGPAFWDDPAQAQQQLAELGEVARRVDRCGDLERMEDEATHMLERVRDNRERRLFPELVRMTMRFERELRFAELEALFQDAEEWGDGLLIFEAQPGSGDGRRWVNQLATTYREWAQSKGFETQVIDESQPEDPVARVTLRIEGTGAFGLLRGEAGTHRIVEVINDPRRKDVTQVALMVLPVPSEDSEPLSMMDIDLSTAPARASGQFLRKIRGTARAIHRFSGTSALVAAATERAAQQAALQILHGRLVSGKLSQPSGMHDDDPWGAVVRSYHFAKRATIKDPRTQASSSNPRDVLDGNLDVFIEAQLRLRDSGRDG